MIAKLLDAAIISVWFLCMLSTNQTARCEARGDEQSEREITAIEIYPVKYRSTFNLS